MNKSHVKYVAKWILFWGVCGAAFGLILGLFLTLFEADISLLKFVFTSAAAGAGLLGYLGGLISLVRKD